MNVPCLVVTHRKLLLCHPGLCLAALLFVSLLPLPAISAETEMELAAAVKKQVRRLADPDLAERDAAEAKLLELGHGILDQLPPVVDRMPEEVKVRLKRLREKLEQAQGIATREPTKLTLTAKGMSLAELLAAIEKQTGNKLVDAREDFGQAPGDLKFTATWKDQTFWTALDAALDQNDLTTYAYRENGTLGIIARLPGQQPRSGHATYQGPFRIEPLKVETQRNLRQPDGANMELQVELAWEPRLSPIAVTVPLDAFEMTDDQQRPIPRPGVGIALENNVATGAKALELSIPWTLPPRDAKRIEKLRGKIQVLLPGRTEAFRFEDLATAEMVVQRRGGVVVTLDAVRQNNELWQAFLRVRFDQAGGALESYRGWYYQNECYLLDADGKRIDFAAFDRTRESENEFGLGYLFDVPGGLKGWTLVYHTPVMIMDVPIEFELTDIPLP